MERRIIKQKESRIYNGKTGRYSICGFLERSEGMKIRFFGRTIEFGERVNVDSFKGEKTLIGICLKKSELRKLNNIKRLILFCFMPYTWLNKQFLKGKL